MHEERSGREEFNQDDDLFIHHHIIADQKQSMLRIDKFLIDRLSNVTRNRIQGAIKEGFIKVNEKAIKTKLQG